VQWPADLRGWVGFMALAMKKVENKKDAKYARRQKREILAPAAIFSPY
jgi:hypothetical protein